MRTIQLVLMSIFVALAAPAAAAADFVFAVTEGVTYYQTSKEIQARFQPLADLLAKALKRPVRIAVVGAYDDVRAGLERQEYDLAFIHPTHVSLMAIKSAKYRSIALTAGYTDYSVALLINKATSYATLGDLKGRTVVTPDPDSITAAMLRAMLRDEQLRTEDVKVITTRYQDAVPFYVQYGFAQAGATAAKSVVKEWLDKGGKVLVSSRPLPIKQLLVSAKISADDEQQVRSVLMGLTQHDAGKQALSALGYKGFIAPNHHQEPKDIAWLGL